MVCIRCQKRPAIIFIQRMDNGQMKQEGYCLHCARELHIKPVDDLMKQFGYKSVMQIPKIDKVVVNVGCGEARENSKVLENVVGDLSQIPGQKPVITRARKSIANFKLREDMPIGAKVTLRGDKMWEFLDRLFNVALPRVRDFRGINGNGFDGRGNFACGIKEQIIFPEIDFEKVDAVRGMDVCFVTTAKTDEEGKELLKALGAPFATENN